MLIVRIKNKKNIRAHHFYLKIQPNEMALNAWRKDQEIHTVLPFKKMLDQNVCVTFIVTPDRRARVVFNFPQKNKQKDHPNV